MPETLLSFLKDLVEPKTLFLAKGAHLFEPGDSARYLYGVEQGMIRMVRFDADGQELVIYRAGSGKTFAEASLFGDVYHCTVIADTDCSLLTFPKKKILDHLDREPALLRHYSTLLSRQVRDLRSVLEMRSIRAADQRILHYLHLHADADGCCSVRGSLMDMAGELGLAHETLYRNLKKLEDNGAIERRESAICLL